MLVQMGYSAPFLGSAFGFFLLISLPIAVLGLFRARNFRSIMKLFITKAFFFFLIIYTLFVVIQYINGTEFEFISYHLKSVFRLAAFYFVTLNLYFGGVFKDVRYSIVVLCLAAFFVLSSIFNIIKIFPAEFGGEYFELDYQMLAFLVLFFFIGNLANSRTKSNIVIICAMVVFLFHLGARTEFYIALALLGAVEFLKAKRRIGVLILFFFGSVFFALIAHIYLDVNWLRDVRIFSVIFSDADPSKISRSELTFNALKTIAEHPFLGNFASHELGAYSHNLLSAWVDFGVFGFFYVLFLVAIPLFIILLNIRNNLNQIYILAVSSLMALVIAYALAKTYNYSMLAVALAYYGIWVSTEKGRLNNEKK
ncbi:hypothetical protein [Comamonas faecalis]|uniref:hypothetical protein n=1 Tax=Comamonas faecalis TaxID=1387849 RepID=UPI0011AF0D7E